MTDLLPCPICSVVPRFPIHPSFFWLPRSKRWRLMTSLCCEHVRHDAIADTREPLAKEWNDWAAHQTMAKAERIFPDPIKRQAYLENFSLSATPVLQEANQMEFQP